MSWNVPWNGKEYDADPTEFSGLEMKAIKLRAGMSYKQLISGIANLDAEAINAVFWTVDRRDNPDLKLDDYAGPPIKVILPHLEAFNTAMEEVGKALTPTTGSPSSSSNSDSPAEPSLTL